MPILRTKSIALSLLFQNGSLLQVPFTLIFQVIKYKNQKRYNKIIRNLLPVLFEFFIISFCDRKADPNQSLFQVGKSAGIFGGP